MKKTTLLIFALLFSIGVFSQKNIAKGRAFKTSEFFAFGIGFERLIHPNLSVQILLNRYGYDMRDHDGGAKYTNSLIPEVRYYLGKKQNKKVFLSVFSEISKIDYFPSNFIERISRPRILTENYIDAFGLGTLLGFTNGTKKRWVFEFYIGGKNTFAIETKKYLSNQIKTTERYNVSKFAIRVGGNVGYRF